MRVAVLACALAVGCAGDDGGEPPPPAAGVIPTRPVEPEVDTARIESRLAELEDALARLRAESANSPGAEPGGCVLYQPKRRDAVRWEVDPVSNRLVPVDPGWDCPGMPGPPSREQLLLASLAAELAELKERAVDPHR